MHAIKHFLHFDIYSLQYIHLDIYSLSLQYIQQRVQSVKVKLYNILFTPTGTPLQSKKSCKKYLKVRQCALMPLTEESTIG